MSVTGEEEEDRGDVSSTDDFVPFEIAMREPGRFVVIKFAPDPSEPDWGLASIDVWDNPEEGEPVLEFVAHEERMKFDDAYARARQHAARVGARGIAVYMLEGTNQ